MTAVGSHPSGPTGLDTRGVHARPRADTPRPLPALSEELSGRHDVSPSGAIEGSAAADWMGRGAWLVSGVLAAAVVLALVVWEPARYARTESDGVQIVVGQGSVPGGLSPTVLHLAEARVVAGAPVWRGGARLSAGAALREGDELRLSGGACLHIEPSMRVCAARETVLSVQVLAGQQRVFEVHRGELWLDARAPGDTRLVTRREDLRVTAARAKFSFEAGAEGASVRVALGDVTVSRHHESEVVGAGYGARYDEATGLGVFPLDEQGRRRLARARRSAAGGALVRTTTAPSTTEARPGTSGDAPIVAGEPGAESGAVVDPAVTDAQGAVATPAAEAISSPELPPTPAESGAELALAHAEALRDAQRYAEADEAFARLVAQHAGSPFARQAAVELGDLRLRQRDDATSALGAYRTFLSDATAGPLDARARLGVIAALRRLNRFAQERKAIGDFVARYPGNPQVPKLEARRTFLGGS